MNIKPINHLAIELTCEIGEALTAGEITWAEYQIANDAIIGLADCTVGGPTASEADRAAYLAEMGWTEDDLTLRPF